jgi:hypothetical protein
MKDKKKLYYKYSPKVTDSSSQYIKINTLDGQIKIPTDALPYLKTWSRRLNSYLNYEYNEENENVPTFNVSSCYLTRLISISCACFQLHSLFEDENEELIIKKTKQVLSMFDSHNRDGFTSFYDEIIEMENGTNSLLEFIKSVTISPIGTWTTSTVSKMLGYKINPLDSTFTRAQYITIAIFAYLEHTKPTEERLNVTFKLLENADTYIDFQGNKIETWVPEEINIEKSIRINLVSIRAPNRLLYNNYDMLLSRIYGASNDQFNDGEGMVSRIEGASISTKVKFFLLSLFNFLRKFKLADPSERKWLE